MEKFEISDIQEYDKDKANSFVELVTKISYEEWFIAIAETHIVKDIYAADIPQFSNFDVGTMEVVSLIRQLGDYGPTYEKIGRDLLGKGRNKVAYLKYGENHTKLAEQFGLLKEKQDGRKKTVFLTEVGKCFDCLEKQKKREYLNKVILLIPIIGNIIFSSKKVEVIAELEKHLASSTAKRRSSNVKFLLKKVQDVYCDVNNTEEYVNLRG